MLMGTNVTSTVKITSQVNQIAREIQTYQKLLCKNWYKYRVNKLKQQAEEACGKFENTVSRNAEGHSTEALQKVAHMLLQSAYDASNKAFVKTINQMKHRYATGSKRLAFYSKPMVELRRMRSRGQTFGIMWRRRRLQANPFDSPSARGHDDDDECDL